ncbi:uncharacterized protein TRIADDRAFT_60944 [Trichoplax adhaerens]|uniref:SASH1/NUB1 homeodomain-like domain-containing protein n=1 Tax=Trichoplax adhaerens TaxID=10228 RepID=B3S9K9_TRIAD|nr:hypothetical protein TRIADDRAFT_60944 [Trichoplax adhaerens]EDV20554.1 hypothetical protein TRIADDRAFT_60944 [Trichoplax adhaerens]|eukprot:XP_002116980.1 hypothetical protein TRIADDRAFT_60944 [Trichoplax adhaerens]
MVLMIADSGLTTLEDSDRLSELALNYSDTLDASALEILQQLQSLRVRGIKQNIKSKVVSPIANRAESEKDNRNDIYLERREETSGYLLIYTLTLAVPKRPSQDNNAALGQIQDGRPKTGKTWKRNLSLKMSNLKKDIKEATSTKLRSTLNLSLRRKSTGEMDSDTGTEVDRMEENYRKEHIRRDSSSTESVIRRRSRRDSSPTDSAARKGLGSLAYSPSPTIGKSLSQSDRLKLLKAVRDKKMSMETAIKLAEELDNTEAENNARLSGYSQNEESGGNRNLHLRDNEDDVDDSMKITVMPPVRRSLSSHNLRHRSPPRSDLNMKRYSMINDLSSGNAAPASRKERPKSEYRRSNIDVMVYQKLSNEGIDLTVHPYTDKNGANIVAYDLIGRFAEDLGVSSTKITLAIDRIRVQELQRLNLHANIGTKPPLEMCLNRLTIEKRINIENTTITQ